MFLPRRLQRSSLLLLSLGLPPLISLLLAGCGDAIPDYSPEELDQAEAQVREAFHLQDYEFGAEVGQQWARWAPDALELKAWTVANLAKAGRHSLAVDLAAKMAEEHPDSPWASFATAAAIVWTQDKAHGSQALEVSAKALGGLPELIDAVLLRGEALYLFLDPDSALAFVETLAPAQRAHPDLRAAMAGALWPTDEMPSDALLDRMLAIQQGILQEDPNHLEANLQAATIFLYQGRDAAGEVFPCFQRAAAATPSPLIHARLWSSMFRDSGLGEEEQYARVVADVREIMESGGASPARWAALGGRLRESGLPELADEAEARVLEEYPNDPATEAVWANRFRALAREIWVAETPAEEGRAEKEERLAGMLEEFIDRRPHHDPDLLLDARWDLFLLHREDPETDPEKLAEAAGELLDQMELWPGPSASARFATLATTLAHEAGAPEEARRAMGLWQETLEAQQGPGEPGAMEEKSDPEADAEKALFAAVSGSLLLQEGRLDEAEEALTRARDVDPESWYSSLALPFSYLYSGRLMERRAELAPTEGDAERFLRAAEEWYLEGVRMDYDPDPRLGRPWTNPTETALAALYEERHGGLEGFEEYLAAATDEGWEERRTEILAERIQDPQPMTPFVLETLDGEEVRSEFLLGRVLVISFWGTW